MKKSPAIITSEQILNNSRKNISLFSFCISCFSKLKSYKKTAIEIIKVLKLEIALEQICLTVMQQLLKHVPQSSYSAIYG